MPEKPPSSAMIRMMTMIRPMLMALSPARQEKFRAAGPVPSSPGTKQTARRLRAGRPTYVMQSDLQPIEDLVGPEALEPVQRLVQPSELVGRDAADLLDRAHVLLVERAHRLAHVGALVGQLGADRAAVDARTLVIEEAHLDELLQIVGDVRAEVIAARAQLTRGQLLVADVEQQQRLHGVDVGAAPAVEFVLDDVKQAAMQPLDQRQR